VRTIKADTSPLRVFSDTGVQLFFPKTDTLCAELCNHAEGRCDEITGKCKCDWSDRSVEWCLEGSYGYQIKGAMYDVLSHFSDLMYTIFKLRALISIQVEQNQQKKNNKSKN